MAGPQAAVKQLKAARSCWRSKIKRSRVHWTISSKSLCLKHPEPTFPDKGTKTNNVKGCRLHSCCDNLKELKPHKMKDYEAYCEKLSIDELKNEISRLTHTDDKSHSSNLTFALGTYMVKLQQNSNYAPIFPLELSPILRDKLQEWGKQYSERVLIVQGGLQKFQVDAALTYTFFQNVTNDQWEKISSGEIDNLLPYIEDVKKEGKSEYELPDEYKLLADKYIIEYKTAKSELFEGLDKYQKKLSGCYIPIIIAFVAVVALIWYFFF